MMCKECGRECDTVRIKDHGKNLIQKRYVCWNCDFLYGEVQTSGERANE